MRFKTVRPAGHLTVIAICMGVFVASLLLALRHELNGWDKEVFKFVYGWSGSLQPPFWLITQLGGLWTFIAAVGVFTWQKKNRVAVKLLLCGASAFVFVQVLKTLIAKPRPLELMSDLVSRDHVAPGFAFPSGHAATAAVIGLCIAPYVRKRYRPLVYLGIFSVAVSRIYLGVHTPIDVIGGAAVGVAAVKSYELIALKLGLEKRSKRA